MNTKSRRPSRVVVKVGTNSVTEGFSLSASKISRIVGDIMQLRKQGTEVILVSSGAIAAGVGRLGLTQKPQDTKKLQALAAVGQNELMKAYGKAFAKHGQKVGQVLLTRKDFTDRKSYLNIKNTLSELLKSGIIPVINENDSVSVEEILSGDNDNLAAIVAVNLEAGALVMLSDSGLKMRLEDKHTVPIVAELSDEIRKAAGGSGSKGKGGMASKIRAAEKTMHSGVDLFIADAKKQGALEKILANPTTETLASNNATMFPSQKKLSDREHWMLYSSKAAGTITVDDGAKKALLEGGGSLLPSGITGVSGSFSAGDVVGITDSRGCEIARGVTNYSAADAKKIMGKKTSEAEKTLGRKTKREVVYRGNMVVK